MATPKRRCLSRCQCTLRLWGFMPETEGHFNQPGAITPQNGYFVILSLQ
ncbi:hypothetical protein O5901_18960 [Proteus mirabilis]|nr:hypothetical protein [Proteus mirabilis]